MGKCNEGGKTMPKNTPMRRKDRKVTDEDAIRFILMNQEVLHLGLSDSDRIYVVPVNYAFTYKDGHPGKR